MNRYKLTALAIFAGILLTGCSGGNESSAPQVSDGVSTAEDTAASTTADEPSEVSQPVESDVSKVISEPQTTTPVETSEPVPEETFIPEWIFGTWSVTAVNGQEYWEWAGENGIEEERQLIFDSEMCRSVSGMGGIDDELTYVITDEGAELYAEDGALWARLVYDPQMDILSLSEDDSEYTAILRRGGNPQQEQQSGGGYIADWIYGTWAAVDIEGQPFSEWAVQNGVTEEYKLEFTPQGCIISGSEKVLRYSITDEGAVVYDEDGGTTELVYDYINDTLSATEGENTFLFKRENGIQDTQAESE